jgi:hypothetical protein
MTAVNKALAARPQPDDGEASIHEAFLPPELARLEDPQTDIPRIAKDAKLLRAIDEAVQRIPSHHELKLGDARSMASLPPNSLHLVLTSPPYWTLKEYRVSDGQMGHIESYDEFLTELDKVWTHCFRALVPGGRLVCVVGDVCLSRRKNADGIRSFPCTRRFRNIAARNIAAPAAVSWENPSNQTSDDRRRLQPCYHPVLAGQAG